MPAAGPGVDTLLRPPMVCHHRRALLQASVSGGAVSRKSALCCRQLPFDKLPTPVFLCTFLRLNFIFVSRAASAAAAAVRLLAALLVS